MNYLQSIVYIESLSPTTVPFFERMQKFMQQLGDIQDDLVSLHIGGTNGKGSTTAIADSVLRALGLKVGRFTGPHLLRWNERFHVDGKPISDDEFADLATRVRQLSEAFGAKYPDIGTLTWFEFLTAMAFLHFNECQVDVAVFEVGLGGRWDATNVLSRPAATAITNVDLDHMHILGATVQKIAQEKAGIIKEHVPVVTAASGVAFDEIAKVAKSKSAKLIKCSLPDQIAPDSPLNSLALLGCHQRVNAMVALSMLEAAYNDLRFSNKLAGKRQIDDASAATEGFKNVYWPGRMQYLPDKHLILDGAHNPAGALALRSALDELFPGPRIFVLGAFANKDTDGFIANLLRDREHDQVIAAEITAKRQVVDAAEIARLAQRVNCRVSCVKDIGLALKKALSERQQEIVIATGSLSTVKESMLALGWSRVEQGQAIQAIRSA